MLFDIYNIDEAVYPPEERSTMKQIMDRFISSKNDYLLAYCGNKLIGYMSYFPINNRCRDELINNDDFMDGRIDGTHILENKLQGSSVYIISVAVLPEYQGLGLGLALSKELNKRLRYLNYAYGVFAYNFYGIVFLYLYSPAKNLFFLNNYNFSI